MRCEEPGWIRIGITCTAGRRSLWWRVNLIEGVHAECPSCHSDDFHYGLGGCEGCFMSTLPYKFKHSIESKDIASIELCAGREGDDEYVKFYNDGGKQFYDLWSLLSAAQFASET